MILKKGNMWDVFGHTGLFLITTNPIVRKDGALVMGRGIAKEAKERFPSLPYECGKLIKECEKDGDVVRVAPVGKFDGQHVGIFMVKDHWAADAKLSIIQESVGELNYRLGFITSQIPDFRVDLNFPGIGNGKLRREDVLPIIEQLPDSVHVWEYE